ncbi:hypothetical protein [Helicobacter mustelae]|uniref:Autotransporter domain-containing protein n=1 Tax=Helicobacter mustelae (strain ATCC 43772 / CCUG 25715 / CIP 103759 / LMG 18044 / NCTC 12198 / R85-136P) TaxID=679897 RepID=D3UGR5_HELM1|nr:hypothetical protein [Helicobacter mustelae]CBG39686.1 putative hypothetical protein [Helicobacter mustelae 12198]SQH71192.1 putative vacuolating cytotoxin VacA [Helicobacter mustelae]
MKLKTFKIPSILLSSLLTSVFATDVNIDLSQPFKSGGGNPISFAYDFTTDGKKIPPSNPPSSATPVPLKQGSNYFWAESSTGSTLSLLSNPPTTGSGSSGLPQVATAIFSAPGNNDNLVLNSFNYISIKGNLTTKGQSDSYFMILNGPVPYVSFTLNGANVFSGSNLYIGPIGKGDSQTGGFANVFLSGVIKVDANAIDQADIKGSGQKNATLNFSSEYNNATYTLQKGAVLDLISATNTNSSQVFFNLGQTKEGTIATGQSVQNLGTINITNINANKPGSLTQPISQTSSSAGTQGKSVSTQADNGGNQEKNSIFFNIDLNNQGTINLQNSTLNLISANLTNSGSAGTINIAALATTIAAAKNGGITPTTSTSGNGASGSLMGGSQFANVSNSSSILFQIKPPSIASSAPVVSGVQKSSASTMVTLDSTPVATPAQNTTFSISSQNINVMGVAATDASKLDALIGSRLTITVAESAASAGGAVGGKGGSGVASSPTSTILFTGSSSNPTIINVGNGAGDDRNTVLALGASNTPAGGPVAQAAALVQTAQATPSGTISFKLDNFAAINIAGGAKLDLTSNQIAATRTYTTSNSTGSALVSSPSGSTTVNGILNFYNQGSITIKGVPEYYATKSTSNSKDSSTSMTYYPKDGQTSYFGASVNPNVSIDAAGKKVILTDYITTVTTGKQITNPQENCTDLTNCTLTTKITAAAGSLTFDGGYNQILAGVVYNFGNLILKNNATLDLSKISMNQNGQALPSMSSASGSTGSTTNGANSIIGFVNAGVFVSDGGVIDARATQPSSATDINGENANSSAYTLVITENKKEKVFDPTPATTPINGASAGAVAAKGASNELKTEGALWAANKANQTRAAFIVQNGTTIIRAHALINKGITIVQGGGILNLDCVGSAYCYNGRYFANPTTNQQGKSYVSAPSNATDNGQTKIAPTQIVFNNIGLSSSQSSGANSNNKANEGILQLSGGTINTIDSYRYQDPNNNYADVNKYIYHSLKIEGGALDVSGGAISRILVGLNDSTTNGSSGTGKMTSALTLDHTNLSLQGASRLLIFTQKDNTTTNTMADVTWMVGQKQTSTLAATKSTGVTASNSPNTFTMSFANNSFANNTGGFFVLGSAQNGNFSGGVFNIQTANTTQKSGNTTPSKDFEFVIDLSNLSGTNTLLLDKQYNFIIAKQIQIDGQRIASAKDFNMIINFGSGLSSTGTSKDYGNYDAALCGSNSKFCLNAQGTGPETAAQSSSSDPSGHEQAQNGQITIGQKPGEGVAVIDKSKSSEIPNLQNSWQGSGVTYGDFVTFSKIYKEGSGSCNFSTLEGCAVIGFSAIKSQNLLDHGILGVFQNIKDRANQLKDSGNPVFENAARGVSMIEDANPNAKAILQSVAASNGALTSNMLLNLQNVQYTGNLGVADSVARTLNTINNSLNALSNNVLQMTELSQRLIFTSTLATNARLAQMSSPYNTAFARLIRSLKGQKLADNGDLYNYSDRFDYDHNVWAQAIGAYGGLYGNGYNALGGFSAGYDKIFDRILWGGFMAYAYSHSMLDRFNHDFTAGNNTTTHNLELGSYMRAYINSHEVDVVLSETFAYSVQQFRPINPIHQKVHFGTFTTNLIARYGYVFPIDSEKGFYIKPYGAVDLYYQYNTQQKGRGPIPILGGSRNSGGMAISVFAEIRKYADEKKYFYFTPGITQYVFNLSTRAPVYLGSSPAFPIFYKLGNQIRTYLVLMGGGEVELKSNLFLNFGVGAKISWDRYFVDANIGLKYKFNTN